MREAVGGATLSAEGRSAALWWFDQLPRLYRELVRTTLHIFDPLHI
jgi:hypothetical protein